MSPYSPLRRGLGLPPIMANADLYVPYIFMTMSNEDLLDIIKDETTPAHVLRHLAKYLFVIMYPSSARS